MGYPDSQQDGGTGTDSETWSQSSTPPGPSDRRTLDPSVRPEHRRSDEESVSIHAAISGASAVLFDFDFTLADSSVGIINCINYALVKIGLAEASTDDILKTIGLYLPEALVVLKGEDYRHRGDEFFGHFTRKADDVMVENTFFLPGAGRALTVLNRRGYRIGIVSTKYRYRIETTLDRDGLRGAVDMIVGGEDVTQHKPSPEGLFKISDRLGVAVADCVYIGDNEVDARAAQAAEMPFVGVLSGSTSSDTFNDYPNRAVIGSVADII